MPVGAGSQAGHCKDHTLAVVGTEGEQHEGRKYLQGLKGAVLDPGGSPSMTSRTCEAEQQDCGDSGRNGWS